MADEADIDRIVLRPMRALFPAPRHLRADEDAHDAALALYRQSLARFDEEVLQRAWQRVVEQNDFWCWPKLPTLLAAAEQAQRELHPAAAPEAWVEEALMRSQDYTRRFLKTSAHASRAREGGYEPQLKCYVQAAAWVQAQLIAGRQGVGYEHAVLFGDGPRDGDAEEAFFARARKQAQSGHIRVEVPARLVRLWQQDADEPARAR